MPVTHLNTNPAQWRATLLTYARPLPRYIALLILSSERLYAKASLTLARILFPQCLASRVILVARSLSRRQCDAHSLRHVVPSVTHKLRTVYKMRDTKCHESNLVVTSRDTLEINFWTFHKFSPRHGTHHFTWPASPRTLSRPLPSLARQIACHGVNPLSSRRSRQQKRLHATGLSICSSVCLSVCLSVAKMQIRDFLKN